MHGASLHKVLTDLAEVSRFLSKQHNTIVLVQFVHCRVEADPRSAVQ